MRMDFQSRAQWLKDDNSNILKNETELLSLWKKHFDILLSLRETCEEIGDEIHTSEHYNFTYQEVDAAIKKLKNNKAV